MATAVQCPNRSCGRMSHLGEDPLGRVFRCPRCLTKLPTTKAAATDSGWTAVLGSLPRRSQTLRSETLPAARTAETATTTGRVLVSQGMKTRSVEHAGTPLACESDEFFVEAFESGTMHCWDREEHVARSGSRESGEVCVAPFEHDDGSGWHSLAGDEPDLAGEQRQVWSREEYHDSPRRQAASSPIPGRGGLSRFRILSVLGEGRHATVYRAFDPLLERQVALKLPRQGMRSTVRAQERFLGEARALARLRHPRIVPIYEAGRDGGRHYIAMALIEGKSLAELVAEGPVLFHRGAEIAAELAEALAYAHGLGIIHRDVKPANVRLDLRGSVYLMDFGIAYRPDSGEVPTPPGIILGTPAYVAPEQAKGGQATVLPASDQYSLGAVLYELLCGRPPFFGSPSSVLLHAIHHDPPTLRTIDPKVPRALAAVCQKALAKRHDRRYPSCQALADDLRRWLRGETPLAYRAGWSRLLG
jgi:hypothetical protein